MLLAVFGKPVMPGDRQVGVLRLRRTLRFFAAPVFPVQPVDERRVSGVAMLAFGVFLRPLLLSLVLRHHRSLGIPVRNHGVVVRIRGAANVGPGFISHL
jgi:hypothetical protein